VDGCARVSWAVECSACIYHVCILHSPSLCCDLKIPPDFVILLPTFTLLHHSTLPASLLHLPLLAKAPPVSCHCLPSLFLFLFLFLSLSLLDTKTLFQHCLSQYKIRYLPYLPAQHSASVITSTNVRESIPFLHLHRWSPSQTSIIPIIRQATMEAWKQGIQNNAIHPSI
jgi:hypothetical protein